MPTASTCRERGVTAGTRSSTPGAACWRYRTREAAETVAVCCWPCFAFWAPKSFGDRGDAMEHSRRPARPAPQRKACRRAGESRCLRLGRGPACPRRARGYRLAGGVSHPRDWPCRRRAACSRVDHRQLVSEFAELADSSRCAALSAARAQTEDDASPDITACVSPATRRCLS